MLMKEHATLSRSSTSGVRAPNTSVDNFLGSASTLARDFPRLGSHRARLGAHRRALVIPSVNEGQNLTAPCTSSARRMAVHVYPGESRGKGTRSLR